MDNNVKLTSRIFAYLLDIILVYIVITFAVSIRFLNPYYDEYLEAYDKYNETLSKEENITNLDNLVDTLQEDYYHINKYGVTYNFITCLIILLYFGIFQKYNKGQTLGKKIMKIKVVDNETNENLSLLKYFLRLLPLQFVYIGGFLPMLLTAILVLLLNSKAYLYASSVIMVSFMIVTIVNICFVLFRKDHRGLHDLIAGSKVVNEIEN